MAASFITNPQHARMHIVTVYLCMCVLFFLHWCICVMTAYLRLKFIVGLLLYFVFVSIFIHLRYMVIFICMNHCIRVVGISSLSHAFLFAHACFICHCSMFQLFFLPCLSIMNYYIRCILGWLFALYFSVHSFSVNLCALCILCIRLLFLFCNKLIPYSVILLSCCAWVSTH